MELTRQRAFVRAETIAGAPKALKTSENTSPETATNKKNKIAKESERKNATKNNKNGHGYVGSQT